MIEMEDVKLTNEDIKIIEANIDYVERSGGFAIEIKKDGVTQWPKSGMKIGINVSPETGYEKTHKYARTEVRNTMQKDLYLAKQGKLYEARKT